MQEHFTRLTHRDNEEGKDKTDKYSLRGLPALLLETNCNLFSNYVKLFVGTILLIPIDICFLENAKLLFRYLTSPYAFNSNLQGSRMRKKKILDSEHR
jgi:hypothetical protein